MVKRIRQYKGIYYFNTFAYARRYALDHGWPTDHIIGYERGWAIQKYVSGPYYGPKD